MEDKQVSFAQPWLDSMEATREEMAPLMEVWVKRLRLDRWEVDSQWHYGQDRPEGSDDANAWACVQWEYMRGTVHFCLPLLERHPSADRERIVVHELCHFLVAEMREYSEADRIPSHVIRHEERVVSHLTAILMDAMASERLHLANELSSGTAVNL